MLTPQSGPIVTPSSLTHNTPPYPGYGSIATDSTCQKRAGAHGQPHEGVGFTPLVGGHKGPPRDERWAAKFMKVQSSSARASLQEVRPGITPFQSPPTARQGPIQAQQWNLSVPRS